MAHATPSDCRSHKGILVTAALATTASLAGAAFLSLRKRGITPNDAAKKLGGRAKSAGTILRGESRAAYQEMREVIIARLAAEPRGPSKSAVFATVREVLAALKRHGTVTKDELAQVAEQLKADWYDLVAQAQKQQRPKRRTRA